MDMRNAITTSVVILSKFVVTTSVVILSKFVVTTSVVILSKFVVTTSVVLPETTLENNFLKSSILAYATTNREQDAPTPCILYLNRSERHYLIPLWYETYDQPKKRLKSLLRTKKEND